MRAWSTTALWLLAAPLLAVSAWLFVVAAGEQVGRRPFSAIPLRNSAEAAAAADPATMLRFIRMGDEPTRMHNVRPDLISSQVLRVTTLEAAMWSRRIELIRLLDRQQAIIGSAHRQELACLAADLDMPDVVAYLGSDAGCVRGAAVERIIARSNPEPGR